MLSRKEKTVLNRLRIIITSERDLLLSGELSDLSRILDEKAKLLHALSDLTDAEFASAEVSQISTLMKENQNFLGSARRGLEAAKSRIDQITESSHGFRTYTKELSPKLL
ncbi:hypothetical protein C8N43_2253 [Litoreibacter ponti]|uniref:FlgN protein n=1 Tax=Litoreibacter ponti TaxID=1510457 RepID=A0A2T6BNC5_9RHOB|nr:hypothetical protein C8N43_2253 [Litoreibacter ponti]